MRGAAWQPRALRGFHEAHQVLSGTGKIRFHRGIIFATLRLWMRIPARSWAITERSCGRPTAEAAGPFRPAARHKLYGPFLSLMHIPERLWATGARFSGQQMATTGPPKRVEQRVIFAECGSQTVTTEQLLARVASSCEPQTAETAGSLHQVEPRTSLSEFRSLTQALECRLAERGAKARFSERPTAEARGRLRRTPGLYSSSMFRSPMLTTEPLSVTEAPFSGRPMGVTPGHLKSVEQRRVFTGSLSQTCTMGRSAALTWAEDRPSSFEPPTEGTHGLSRQTTRCLRVPMLSTQCPSRMRLPD